MDKSVGLENLQPIIDQAQQETGITNLEEIYRGKYYSPTNIRNVIFRCQYGAKAAVLKAYDDPRETFEPQALKDFHEHNQSKIIHAPELYASKMLNSRQGWLLMEELPAEAKRFERLVSADEREEFLKIYQEYRRNFPENPTRELMLAEHLPAADFHLFRIARWLELANQADYNYFLSKGEHITDPVALADLVTHITTKIRADFEGRAMVWCHGHFKGHEVFKVNADKYYLLDFAHSKLYPEGYELGFIIWADYLMSENWNLGEKEWQVGAQEWIDLATQTAKDLGSKNPEELLKSSLLERTIGTILADVIGAERPIEEKRARLNHLFKLANSLL